MEKEQIENILNNLLKTGGDFGEVYLEDKETNYLRFVDNRLDDVNTSFVSGMGLRLALGTQVYYGATNNFNEDSVSNLITTLNKNINEEPKISNIKLNDLEYYQKNLDLGISLTDLKTKMHEINNQIRNKCKLVNQVEITLQNKKETVTIANHTGKYVKEDRAYSRIFIIVSLEDGNAVAKVNFKKGVFANFNFINEIDFDKEIDYLIKTGLDKLYAKPCLGKVMPVIISNKGGVLFHEACGHALEATSVATNRSVLSNKLNKKVATNKVTIIDDGTIPNEWGTTIIDDEGNKTKKNVLIENGILTNYLIDEINNRRMNLTLSGSGRRESYLYAPTSRMNNTYLSPGNDTFEDMLKDIKLGLYAKELGGGCVDPETGDFNFGVDVAYMIRDGKIAECVKSASLIGNTKDILNEVEMVGNDLALWDGMCGSISGYVPVNCGMPMVKLGSILVGGNDCAN